MGIARQGSQSSRSGRPLQLLLSMEHASCSVPGRWKWLFEGSEDVLAGHRGWDPGTRELGDYLVRSLRVPAVTGKVSRLLIEMNRSLHHPRLFSAWSASLGKEEKAWLIERYWEPYRAAMTESIRTALASGRRVLHVSLHSFTPVLDGEVRNCEVGFLYDPAREFEAELARRWKEEFRLVDGSARVRMNYPYRGTADGLTTALRREFSGRDYAGIELEINQRFPLGPSGEWKQMQLAVRDSLQRLMEREGGGGRPGA